MRVESQMKVESQESRVESQKRNRTAVTLVELLITMMIISILAAMILGVAAVAGNTAREAKTRSMITRLHTLLMDQADSYKTRRVKLSDAVKKGIEDAFPIDPSLPGYDPKNGVYRGQALAAARLNALREMMLMEMPDRWSDVLLSLVPSLPAGIGDELYPVYLTDRTDLANIYLRRYVRTLQHLQDLVATGVLQSNEIRQKLVDNQGAECLYMIVTLACGDGEARSQFHESDIGDTDGDGAPEFLDGWGNPISFLRWAPGFNSEIQLNLNVLEDMPPADANAAVAGDHDPFDMYRVDSIAYRLVPLIYSAGRDESYGLYNPEDAITWRGNPQSNPPGFNPSRNLTPYKKYPISPPNAYYGTDDGTKTATDNIHNHLLGTR